MQIGAACPHARCHQLLEFSSTNAPDANKDTLEYHEFVDRMTYYHCEKNKSDLCLITLGVVRKLFSVAHIKLSLS